MPVTPAIHPGGHSGKRILIFLGFYFSAGVVVEELALKSPSADQTLVRAIIVAVAAAVMWWITHRLSKSWVVEDASAQVAAIADENKRIADGKKTRCDSKSA
jgi:isoprenylcysteine carboxyl methyltransferase (ICMT) family protein YpbQ